jgi:hypothetical protein
VGTYTVETNCQGTLTFTNGPTYNIFASSNGKEVSMIQTTANTVFQGTASKASR